MTAPSELVGSIRSFLIAIEPLAKHIPDPFSHDYVTAALNGDHNVPPRLLGVLARVGERDREIARRFLRERATGLKPFFHGGAAEMLALCAREVTARIDARGEWYRELDPEDRTSVDAFCLSLVVPLPCETFSQSIPKMLHGPMARLAVEHAVIVRKFADLYASFVRNLKRSARHVERGVTPELKMVTREEEVVKSRLRGRWFRELTSGQIQAIEGTGGDRPALQAKVIESEFAKLLDFAKAVLKGQERAVVEALCKAGGEMKIPDLGAVDGVDWTDPFQGFKDVQRRLHSKVKPKLKPQGWQLSRHNSTAKLVKLKVRMRR